MRPTEGRTVPRYEAEASWHALPMPFPLSDRTVGHLAEGISAAFNFGLMAAK